MKRREFLKATVGVAGAAATFDMAKAGENSSALRTKRAREYLRSLMPSRKDIERFTSGPTGPEKLSPNMGWTFAPDLGWTVCDAVRRTGINRSRAYFNYEPDDKARKVINSPDKPCRIHTYGDSFTSCAQVSNCETWQEYLAAHLQEPVRNYGVGGYSVYQAYLRMLKVEKQFPAEYIILNIWDDDHFRNLDAWRSIRKYKRSPCGFPLPYLKVNVQQKRCEQIDNICKKPEDLYKLRDEQFVWQTFKDDPVLQLVLDANADKMVSPPAVSTSFGCPGRVTTATTEEARRIRKKHAQAALYATENIITWTEKFVKETGKKLMLVLSFGSGNVACELAGRPKFDQSFVNWLKDKPYPVIDMRDAFKADYRQFKVDIDTYLHRYYIGHHSPAGNFFTAWTIKDQIVKWLDPRPLPYR